MATSLRLMLSSKIPSAVVKNVPILNYDRFLNSVSINRMLSPLRNVWAIQNKAGPKMVGLGAGAPNPQCFPYESVTVKTKDGRTIALGGQELDTALNYTASPGYPPLVEWLLAFQKRIHDPPYAREHPELNQLILTSGSEDGQCKVLEMIMEPGDPVLITAEAYPGSLSALRPLGAKLLPVEMDEEGVRPDSMERWLRAYDSVGNVYSHSAIIRKRPKIFVIQPNHVNPTGVSTTLERRKQIYQLACQYDLLLIEDDPYYFLAFSNGNSGAVPLPSFLSMDTEGRVLRLDSFSKTVASGLRLGTLSGPQALVEKVMMHISCSSLHASTFSQIMLLRLLTEYGQNGYLKHCESVADFYERQCRMMLKAAERHLTGVAQWSNPSGGMFLWIKLLHVKDSRRMMEEKALEKMVMLAPGCYFMCDETMPTPFLRASFSGASQEEMNEGFKRLAEMAKEERNRQGA